MYITTRSTLDQILEERMDGLRHAVRLFALRSEETAEETEEMITEGEVSDAWMGLSFFTEQPLKTNKRKPHGDGECQAAATGEL